MEHITNQAIVRGTLAGAPEYSHENHGRSFFRFFLEVPRLSGAVDILPVIASRELLEGVSPEDGGMITVTGQIRSHNLRVEGKRRLLIFIFASDILIEDGEPLNEVILEGPICREPTFRRTPLGREICDAMLAVPRGYQRADYLPCILWGRTAQLFSKCNVSDQVRIRGRLQSREYTKITEDGPLQKTAYEISALTGEILPPEELREVLDL